MAATKIEWTDRTWNPVTGCTPISEGCQRCYAKRMATRLAGRFGYPKDEPFRVTVHWDKVNEPLSWKEPCKAFVCSMSDLFHESIRPLDLVEIFKVMAKTKHITYQLLTKRPQEVMPFLEWWQPYIPARRHIPDNAWLGVTTENQQRADERIPLLLETPAAIRFVSCEPLLDAVDLWGARYPLPKGGTGSAFAWGEGINWVIIGAETGSGARPCDPRWVESLIDQCRAAAVPLFVKGKLAAKYPYQEFPEVR